ncbi:MAG: hypothetical protein ACYC5J_10195 [Chloroflexota bacterium]
MRRFSRHVAGRPLRPYQLEPAPAILDSALHRKGLIFTVMMARQAGKNELSAQLELYLLNLFQIDGIAECRSRRGWRASGKGRTAGASPPL